MNSRLSGITLTTCSFVFSAHAIMAQMVDHLTGNLLYDQKLISIPMPDGPPVEVSAMYAAGIGMDQPASEIGLGWMFNQGSRIDRSVNLVPDDWRGAHTYNPNTGSFGLMSGFIGALGEEGVSHDIEIHTTDGLKKYYDYGRDRYTVSGGSLTGEIEPMVFDYEDIEVDVATYSADYSDIDPGRLQFIFKGSFNGEMQHDDFPEASAPVNTTAEVIAPGGVNDYSGDQVHNGKPLTSFYVERFTNAEILSMLNAGTYQFFIDSELPVRRTAGETSNTYYEYLTGAFRITDAAGYVYHYSLPVYLNYSTTGQYPLNEDFSSLITSDAEMTRESMNGNYYVKHVASGVVVEYRQEAQYPVTWHLTAITGPQYEDVNHNHQVDPGDSGYWVKFNFSKVYNNFSHREPRLGHEVTYVGDRESDGLTGYIGVFKSTDTEKYLLKSIETRDHVLMNIWGERLDEHESINHNVYNEQVTFEGLIGNNGTEYNMPVGTGSGTPATTVTDFKGVLYDNGGKSLNYVTPNPGFNTVFTIDPPGASQVTLEFDDFDVTSSLNDHLNPEQTDALFRYHCSILPSYSGCYYFYKPDAPCTYQWLTFYDGPSTSSPVIEIDGVTRFCGRKGGDLAPEVITSSVSGTGNAAITVEMHTAFSSGQGFPAVQGLHDISMPRSGFKANWKTDGSYHAFQENWKGRLFDDGGENGNYQPSQTYTYTISPRGADGVGLTFNSLNLGSGDVLRVYSGTSTAGTIVYNSANGAPSGTYSPQGSDKALTVYFSSDASGAGTGFDLEWAATWTNRPIVSPSFRLEKLLLLHRKDVSEDWDPRSSAGTLVNANFETYDLIAHGSGIYNSEWFSAHETQIKAKVISAVEFDQDYSLCRGYFDNIHVFVPNSNKFDGPEYLSTEATNASYANSGKLSLNKIRLMGHGYQQIMPSYVFDYKASISTENPDFDLRKKDNWGLYKSDGENGWTNYRTSVSAAYADAWSLKEITKPLGESVKIEYASDQAFGELTNDLSEGVQKIRRVYHIVDVTPLSNPGEDWTVQFDEADDQQQTDITSSSNEVNWFIPFKCLNDDYHSFSNIASVTYISAGQYTVTGLEVMDEFSGTILTSYGCTPIEYRGGGYALVDLDNSVSYPVGDLRVTSIESSTIGESYTTEYTYEGGLVVNDLDMYGNPSERTFGSNTQQHFMDPISFTVPADPGVYYTKCTVKRKGQAGEANGEMVHTFSLNDGTSEFIASTIQHHASDEDTVIDLSRKYINFFGSAKSVITRDKMGNIMSVVEMEYTYTPSPFVQVSSFREKHVVMGGGGIPQAPNYKRKINISRDYASRMTTQKTSYLNQTNVSTVLRRDPVTGLTLATRQTVGQNEDIQRATTAYTLADYVNMGPKSKNAAYTNQLMETAGDIHRKDSTTFSVTGFASNTVRTYTKAITVRKIDGAQCSFQNASVTLPAYTPGRSGYWNGDLETHGLYSTTGYQVYNHSLTTQQADWLIGSTPKLYDEHYNLLSSLNEHNEYGSQRTVFDGRFSYMRISQCPFEGATASGFEALQQYGNSVAETVDIPAYEGAAARSVQVITGKACTSSFFEGEIKGGGDFSQVTTAHTGKSGAKITDSGKLTYAATLEKAGTITTAEAGRRYRASVWVHNTSASTAKLEVRVNGTLGGSPYSQTVSILKSNSANVSIDEWTLMNLEIGIPASVTSTSASAIVVELSISGSSGNAIFDDLRFFPVESTDFAVDVFDERTGLKTASLDIHNFATFYEYFPDGQLKKMKAEVIGKGIVDVLENTRLYARGLNN